MADRFFDAKVCERCGGGLEARTMSWFTDETICMDCSMREAELKNRMRCRGLDPSAYEGCGPEALAKVKRDLGLVTRWEVQTQTLCGGWTNTWHDDDEKPSRFNSKEEAEAELVEMFIDMGEADMEHEKTDYRVVQVEVEA
jgi:hypothetical protein